MIKEHSKSTNAVGLLKLKFRQRKIIHYSLLACVIFLQLIAVIIWYTDSTKDEQATKALDSMQSLNKISHFTSKINDSFINSQKSFNNYTTNKDQSSLERYTLSLQEIRTLIDSLSFITKDNRDFMKVLMERNISEANIMHLKADIDSIIEIQINPIKSNPAKEFKLNKFEYKKILDSVKTDSYIKVDSVSRKGLFSRLGDAFAGRMDVQKEQLNITVTMKYNDKVVSGSIEDQIANLFSTTNKYYENEFKNLKKSFANLSDQDAKLTELNNRLLELEGVVMPGYNKSLNVLQEGIQKKLQDQYKSNKLVRNYSIVILIVLMLIISLVLLSFTKIAFEYEKKLTAAQDQIRQSLNFKNRIMGMISHEIRSPLSIISIYSKMISSSIKDNEIKETFNSIEFTTNSLLLLANQILEYSKDENYKPVLKNSAFNLKSEIDQIISSMSSLVESKGNKMEVKSNMLEEYQVFSDPIKIHQLFYNLIGNASKFTKNGLILIALNVEKSLDQKLNLKVEIQDNGVGISQNDLNNIFELYYQGAVSGKVNDLGVGLGLNLCKEIVELFGGEIDVQSQERKGTKVVFNLVLSLV